MGATYYILFCHRYRNIICLMEVAMSGIVDQQSILWISTDYSQVNQTNPSQTGFLTDNVIEQAQRSSRHGGQIWNAIVNLANS